MNTLNVNKQFLSVSEHHTADGQRNRTRSERAASLALPLNSLLDFYDKQQEQCKSVTLLPTSVNSIVRRHSSHYYPMLEDKHNAQLPLEHPNDLQLLVNMTDKKYCKGAQVPGSKSTVARVDTPLTPPPPIPRRAFRGKSVWQSNDSGVLANEIAMQAAMTSSARALLQQQKQELPGNVFVYPQQTNISGNTAVAAPGARCGTAMSVYTPSQSGLLIDIATRPTYADADGISDDDRMSLENSVFDESLTSTPVKVASYHNARNAGHVRVMAAGAPNSDLSHVAKRANRSSSSTVDSATLSSGYGSSGHSERFASTSTTADFRSRFSSVDTQSSLDGSLAEKPNDSPLAKNTFKLERGALNDVMHKLNNNELRGLCAASNNQSSNSGNNSTTTTNNNNNNNSRNALPAVPARKPYPVAPKLPPPGNNSNNCATDMNKDTSSVSASASTSSTASAGSSINSSSTLPSTSLCSSSSATAAADNITPKRPVPPAPPARIHNSLECSEAVAKFNGTQPPPPPLTVRNKLNRNKPPPIVYPKLQQRQDSTLSSDSYSITSSPGYNSKNLMETPLLQSSTRKGAPGYPQRQPSELNNMDFATTRFVIGGNSSSHPCAPPPRGKMNFRQDSTISSDSFSQTSSPGYNSKLMEVPLLPALSAKRLCSAPAPIVCRQGIQHESIEELEPPQTLPPLSKCAATPSSLQTIVRFQNGAPHTMSLQHQIINRRKSSNPYITNGRLKFRLFQILINAFALLAIAGGLAAYFNAYPTIKFVNKTIINTIHVEDNSSFGKNPAPGTCLPIIVKFCQGPQIPYNYTVFPNYIGHFGQLETQGDLDAYEALVDVRCYELVSLFLCTLFVPKCGTTGATVPPCKTLCTETMRRCGFFFDVFGLSLPEYLNCKLFKDFSSAEDCVGLNEVRDVMIAAANPKCDGFQCDQNRCLPKEYVCDGHLDCMDQADEAKCERCDADEIYCGDDHCIGSKHICNGIIDCPYGQDERNCLRLSERNGDVGTGVLEVFRISMRQWMPACVKNWDRAVSPSAVCSILGYSAVNATSVVTQRTHRPLLASVNVSTDIWKMYAKKRSTLMQEFSNCKPSEDYPIAELTCSNYECGKVKRERHKPSRRIIGGSQANPGNWPFLAAILGGPEKIFYCAGVLISDQWVLTASHCVGNHTVIDLEDWTIQLGVTRRNSFTYTGQKVKVKTVIPHPQYNMAIAHDNDIALFQLATRVAFHEHLLPVCLPPPSVKFLRPHDVCTVIGWGKREEKDPKSTYEFIVNEVEVPIIRRSQCDEWLDNLTVSEGMVCAGYDDGGKDACQGDSGGPLLCPYPGTKDRWFVGGIVSWGIMCAHPKLPGVYANVIKYVPWIQEQMAKHTRPISEDRVLKYDIHPGGPDILSKMSTGPIRSRKPYYYHNGKPMGIDYYDSDEKK